MTSTRRFRWSTSFVALTVTAMLLLPVAAIARPPRPPEPSQTQEGSVLLPLRFAADPTYSSWPGGQRQVWQATGNNGTVGYTFELSPDVAGGDFVLEVLSGGTGSEDLDIAFYASLTPTVSTSTLMTRQAGGERGFIPAGSRYAVVTMFEGADATFRFEAFTPQADRDRDVPPLPVAPGIYPDFGKGLDDTPLPAREHVVIALVDTGINPYHVAFRRPEYAVHPSEYVSGYPTDAPALGLSFGDGYATNRASDDGPVWSKVERGKLYWIPGTNVIGAMSVAEHSGGQPSGVTPRPIIDDDSHGTGTASVAAGAAFAPSTQLPYGSNPEALVVILEGLGEAAVEWAASQPWIDFISGSYGDSLARPCNDDVPNAVCGSREYRHTGPFVLRDGRTALFSAGNGASRTGLAYDRYSSLRPTSGPSWVITVGAVSPRNGQDYGWHSVPADVSSYGNHWPAAGAFTTNGEMVFSGTSNATPVTAGVFSKALLEARRALKDRGEGIHVLRDGTRVPAQGRRGPGMLADGVLTRLELQDAVLKTAFPEEFDAERWTYDPVIVPDSPLYYTQEGYGVANVESGARAIDVIFGRAPMPDRAEVDAWIARVDGVRDTVYPPARHDGV